MKTRIVDARNLEIEQDGRTVVVQFADLVDLEREAHAVRLKLFADTVRGVLARVATSPTEWKVEPDAGWDGARCTHIESTEYVTLDLDVPPESLESLMRAEIGDIERQQRKREDAKFWRTRR